MTLFNRFLSGVRGLVSRTRVERDLDEEVRAYLSAAIDRKIASGMSPADAARAARLEVGSVEAIKDDVRDVWWERHLDAFLQDVRFAVRWLIKSPRFTFPALLALALGIGATSAIFSVIKGVMLQPLPYRDPDRIVGVWETNRGGTVRNVIAPANFVEWQARNRSFEYLGTTGSSVVTMILDGQPERIEGVLFSADAFNVLGVQPAVGRAYTVQEDLDPDNSAIVLGYEFWQSRLGGRGDVLGLALTANGRRRTVVGVMPRGFTVTGRKADYLLPYGVSVAEMRALRGRGSSYAIARLREGVTLEQATAEMRTIAAQLEKEAPERNARRSVMVFPLQEQMVGELRPAAYALIGAVVLLLLVACVNVANLLLARSASRGLELGMRSALGAGRWRLVRQMLTESAVLAIGGSLGGLLLAAAFHRGLLLLVGDRIPIPRLDEVSLDLPMVAFTIVVALATGIVFGLVPAFASTGRADRLRDAGRHGGGLRLRRLLSGLVVVEVALSLVLITGAGLLLRSFIRLQNVDPGFRTDGVLVARVQLFAPGDDVRRTARFFRDAVAGVSSLPGVQNAAAVTCLPLMGSCIATGYWRLDRPAPASGQVPSTQVRNVTPGSFRTLGIPYVEGRDFSDADTADSLPVAVVSEAVVREQFPGENPLGRQLHINSVADARGSVENAWTVVGVVRDTRNALDANPAPTVYVPHSQLPSGGMALLVRTESDPMSLATSVRRTVRSLDTSALVSDVRTFDDWAGRTIARPRAISLLVAAFALIALALAAVGVYGVMAYSVVERTHEIGVRVALGASTSAVLRQVLGQSMLSVALGVGAGLVAAAVLTRQLERLLFQLEPTDPWTFSIAAIVLMVVGVVAAYVPARRGMRIPPVEALRAR